MLTQLIRDNPKANSINHFTTLPLTFHIFLKLTLVMQCLWNNCWKIMCQTTTLLQDVKTHQSTADCNSCTVYKYVIKWVLKMRWYVWFLYSHISHVRINEWLLQNIFKKYWQNKDASAVIHLLIFVQKLFR